MVRAVTLLCLAALSLTACVPPPPPPASVLRAPPARIGVLLPLSGPNARLGHDLQQAVDLALGDAAKQADIRDTGGTPPGAVAAAQAGLAAGDTVFVGPLTAGETAAVANVAPAVPILAFTSDPAQARPDVWPLGITPQQQVARLVAASVQQGKTRFAAVLPQNAFGDALADGLATAVARAGMAAPVIRRYPNGRAPALHAALRDVTGGAAPAPAADAADPLAPPALPFDALLLAESGPLLAASVADLQTYGVHAPAVQLLGPATWARDAASLPGLAGAWYAAPDPSTRGAFEQVYAATYGSSPPGLASIAYDAAHLARVAGGSPGALTQPGGFQGADGPLALRPDGRVLRGLAVLAVSPDGPRVVEPAPASLASGS